MDARQILQPGQVDVAPRLTSRCSLCQVAFREGDAYKAIFQRRTGLALSITVHQACAEQLQPGDLTLIFSALEQGLRMPLGALRQLHTFGLV